MTTISLNYRLVKSKIRLLDFQSVNFKLIFGLGILSCFLLLVFYIIFINQITMDSYLISNYNKGVSSLLKENKSLHISFAESGLLDNVNGKAKELGFEKISNAKYLEILNPSLASAN